MGINYRGQIVNKVEGQNYSIVEEYSSRSGKSSNIYVIDKMQHRYIKINDKYKSLNIKNMLALLEDPDYNLNAIETLRIYDSLDEKKQRELVGRQFQSLKTRNSIYSKVTKELESINKNYIIEEDEAKIIEDNARADLMLEELKRYY